MPQSIEEEGLPTIEEIWERTPSYPGFQVEVIDGGSS